MTAEAPTVSHYRAQHTRRSCSEDGGRDCGLVAARSDYRSPEPRRARLSAASISSRTNAATSGSARLTGFLRVRHQMIVHDAAIADLPLAVEFDEIVMVSAVP